MDAHRSSVIFQIMFLILWDLFLRLSLMFFMLICRSFNFCWIICIHLAEICNNSRKKFLHTIRIVTNTYFILSATDSNLVFILLGVQGTKECTTIWSWLFLFAMSQKDQKNILLILIDLAHLNFLASILVPFAFWYDSCLCFFSSYYCVLFQEDLF